MVGMKCFFCAMYAKCNDRREDCNEFKERPKKVKRKGGKIIVDFK